MLRTQINPSSSNGAAGFSRREPFVLTRYASQQHQRHTVGPSEAHLGWGWPRLGLSLSLCLSPRRLSAPTISTPTHLRAVLSAGAPHVTLALDLPHVVLLVHQPGRLVTTRRPVQKPPRQLPRQLAASHPSHVPKRQSSRDPVDGRGGSLSGPLEPLAPFVCE